MAYSTFWSLEPDTTTNRIQLPTGFYNYLLNTGGGEPDTTTNRILQLPTGFYNYCLDNTTIYQILLLPTGYYHHYQRWVIEITDVDQHGVLCKSKNFYTRPEDIF